MFQHAQRKVKNDSFSLQSFFLSYLTVYVQFSINHNKTDFYMCFVKFIHFLRRIWMKFKNKIYIELVATLTEGYTVLTKSYT